MNRFSLKQSGVALVALLLVLCMAVPCLAEVDSAKRKDIIKMLELTGVNNALPDLVRPNIDGIVSKIKHKHPELTAKATTAIEQEIQTIFNELMDATMNIFVDMYDRNFTDKEIKELITMYESPVWRKQVMLQGKMYRQMTEEMQKAGAPIMAAGIERIKKRCSEHGIEF